MDESIVQTDLFILDRHALFCRGLVSLLQSAHPAWRCTILNDINELRQCAEQSQAAVVVVDLAVPGLGGLEGLACLYAKHGQHRFVALAETDDRASVLAVLSAGARGYIPRAANPTQFLRAIETIMAGGVFAPASLTGVARPQRAAAPPTAYDAMAMAQLTERQRDVFLLLAEGCATKTIARRLNLGVGTVKVHLAAIYRSIGVNGRMEAVAKAHRGLAAG